MSHFQHKKAQGFKLRFESLEDRTTPAQFGVPWNDPLHLTASFAPDGTTAAGVSSNLQAALDAQMPRQVWQNVILKAFQTWAGVANVNTGLVTDNGASFGSAGATQGDSRFGDIRIGGFPMTNDAMAVSIPPASFVSGTLAGDFFINTAAQFTPDTLYAVALHEIGHTLGLPHSVDPTSVMFSHLNKNTALSNTDVVNVRDLYGIRLPDLNEGDKGNDNNKNGTRLKYSTGFDGSTPIVGYGDLTTAADTDVFYLRQYPGYNGSITFRVQTDQISLLAPQVSVYNSAGRLLKQGVVSGARGGRVTLTLPTSAIAETYYVKVTTAGNTNQIGRYSIAATFDALLKPTVTILDTVMRGAYETLSHDEMQELFQNPDSLFLNDDLHTNDTVAFATNLKPGPGNPSDRHLQTTASLSDATDVDWYRLRAPVSSTNQAWVLTTTVRAVVPNQLAPQVEIYDASMVRLPSELIVNGNGTFTIQAKGALPRGTYFIRVLSNAKTGNYALDATFGKVAADLKTLATSTLATPISTSNFNLYVGQSQLLSTTLTTTGATGSVKMEIVNSSGVIVHFLVVPVGETLSGVSSFLTPGAYTVRFSSIGGTGPLSFNLKGTGLTDPIGPVTSSTTLKPQYQAPDDPTKFIYPGGTPVTDAFQFIFWFLT